MISLILKSKHWQLFLLTFALPTLAYIFLYTTLISEIFSNNMVDPTFIFSYLRFFPLIIMFFMLTIWAWFWSVAFGLQKQVPENVKLNVRLFKFFFFVPLLYVVLISIFVSLILINFISFRSNPDLEIIFGLIAIIIPLHFFAIFCIFYTFIFVAKTYKTVELQREATFSDYAGEFFLVWFYPIGIWVLQPKINELTETDDFPEF
jgi:hypothetical protein